MSWQSVLKKDKPLSSLERHQIAEEEAFDRLLEEDERQAYKDGEMTDEERQQFLASNTKWHNPPKNKTIISKSLVEKLEPKQKKRIKKLLQAAQPTEFMGQEIAQLSDLLEEMKGLDLVKNDKNMQKKFEKFDENNLDLVATASELRKDYETLYNQLRKEIYPKKERKK